MFTNTIAIACHSVTLACDQCGMLTVFAAKDPSGSSSDEGGFLEDGGGDRAAAEPGHTLPVRNSRSVRSSLTEASAW